jgi:hypothetical protein
MPNLATAPAGCGPAIISAAQSTAAAHARRGCRQDVHILVQQRQQQGEAGAEVVLVPHSRFSTTSTPYCPVECQLSLLPVSVCQTRLLLPHFYHDIILGYQHRSTRHGRPRGKPRGTRRGPG